MLRRRCYFLAILIGGCVYAGRVAFAAESIGAWMTIPPPPALSWHTAVLDPLANRMVVFGGRDETSNGSYFRNETWGLSLDGQARWTLLTRTSPLPPSRESHSAVYDSRRRRMLIFGGYNNQALKDVWELSLGAEPRWSLVQTEG